MRARETGSACNGSQLEAIFNDVIKQLTKIVIIIFEGSPRDFGPGFALQSTVASWSRRSRRGPFVDPASGVHTLVWHQTLPFDN